MTTTNRLKTPAEIEYEMRLANAKARIPNFNRLHHRVKRSILGLAPMTCCGRMSGHEFDCYLRSPT